jgi:peptide/nickel transport system permease protein
LRRGPTGRTVTSNTASTDRDPVANGVTIVWTYAAKRILLALPTLFIVSVLVFALLRLVPGDPAELLLGDMADPASIAALRTRLGLDLPWPAQYFAWASALLAGDFGVSISTGEFVLPAMLDRLAVTAQVVLLSFTVAMLIAVPAGLLAAHRQDSRLDLAVVIGVVLCLSVPSFWVGLLLILVFGVKLGWLPTVGWISPTENFWLGLQYLLLPALALLLVEMGQIARMSRASAIEVLRLDYILHARAKGLPESRVLWRHAFPNALAPTVTVAGMLLGSLLGGAAVIETVFTLPGLGRLLVDGIYQRDYPVVQGVLMFVATIQVTMNLLVDLLYPLFDPRVRL